MNDEFLNALIDLGELCLSQIGTIPYEQDVLIEFDNDPPRHHQRIMTLVSENGIREILFSKKILEGKISKSIINYFKNLGDFKKNKVNDETIQFSFITTIFPSLLFEYLKIKESLSFDKDQFRKICLEFTKMWEGPPRHQYSVIPLVNFSMDNREIQLSNGYSIIPFTKEEKAMIWNKMRWSSFISINSFEKCEYKIFRDITSVVNVNGGFLDVLTSLRFLKKEEIAAPIIISESNWLSRLEFADATYNRQFRLPELVILFKDPIVDKYILKPADEANLNKLIDIFSRLRENGKYKQVKTALNWFNDSYNYEDIETKIICYAIVLESTLLYGIDDELTYRLAVRGSVLLNNKHNPDEIYKTLKNFYKIRSKIVHEGQSLGDIKPELQSPEGRIKYSQEINELVREILIAILDQLDQKADLQTLLKDIEMKIHPNIQNPN